jgi:hypothetical protein
MLKSALLPEEAAGEEMAIYLRRGSQRMATGMVCTCWNKVRKWRMRCSRISTCGWNSISKKVSDL